MTVLELNDFLKAFEEEFDVTAAAPVAVAAAAAGGGGGEAAAAEEKDEFDVVLVGRRRQEDPGHQGGPVAHEPRAEGGQGPRRLGARSRCSRRSPRKTPRRPRRQLEGPAPPSSSSSSSPRARREVAGFECLTLGGGRRILPQVPAAPLGAGPLRLHCACSARAAMIRRSRVDSLAPPLKFQASALARPHITCNPEE